MTAMPMIKLEESNSDIEILKNSMRIMQASISSIQTSIGNIGDILEGTNESLLRMEEILEDTYLANTRMIMLLENIAEKL